MSFALTSLDNMGILYKSSLNPNAAVFKSKLNPNANVFTPRVVKQLARVAVDNTIQHHTRDVGGSIPSLTSALLAQKVDEHTKLSKKTALPVVAYTVVYSTTNQRSFLGEYGGAQCTSMSLAAVARWALVGIKSTTEGITDILYNGHHLHVMLREDFKLSTNPDRRVGLDDLPEVLKVSMFDKNVRFTRESNNLCFTSHTAERNYLPTIIDCMKSYEHQPGHQLFVVTIKSWSQAVCLTAGGAILLFDSHGNITHGKTKLEGLAAVLQFRELAQLGSFLVEWRGAGASAQIHKYTIEEETIDIGVKQEVVAEHIHEGHTEASIKDEEVLKENIADVPVKEEQDEQTKKEPKDVSISKKILVKEEVEKVEVKEVHEVEVEVQIQDKNNIAYDEDDDPYVSMMGGFRFD